MADLERVMVGLIADMIQKDFRCHKREPRIKILKNVIISLAFWVLAGLQSEVSRFLSEYCVAML